MFEFLITTEDGTSTLIEDFGPMDALAQFYSTFEDDIPYVISVVRQDY